MTNTQDVPGPRSGKYRLDLEDLSFSACHIDDLVHDQLVELAHQDLAAALRSSEVIRVQAAQMQGRLVDVLRDQGTTWAAIADALYITRQAAQQRFGQFSG